MQSRRLVPWILAPLLLVLFAGMVQVTLPLTASQAWAQAKADWAERAVALENAKNWPSLLAHCLQWTKAEPDNYLAWDYLGRAYLENYPPYREREAMFAFLKALKLKPDSLEVLHHLGASYLRQLRYEPAIWVYKKLLRLKPDDVDAWDGLGFAYANTWNRPAALEAVKQLRRYNPKKADELEKYILQRFDYKKY